MRALCRHISRFSAAVAFRALVGGVIPLFLLAACGRPSANVLKPQAPATPDPREEALIERNVRDRLAEENRITEQQLVNARAAASQRMVGRQMFMKLEEQYRQRQAEIAGAQNAGKDPAFSSSTPAVPAGRSEETTVSSTAVSPPIPPK